MKKTNFNAAPKYETKSNGGNASILFGIGAGALCGLLGFVSCLGYKFSSGDNPALNYASIGFLFSAFVFFGVGAHFMDVSDSRERREKRARFERFGQGK